jgi:hypothetical protein
MLSFARTSYTNERSLQKYVSGGILLQEMWAQATTRKDKNELHEVIIYDRDV